MEDDVGSSIVCLGVAGVSADVLKRAEAVNLAKTGFPAISTPSPPTTPSGCASRGGGAARLPADPPLLSPAGRWPPPPEVHSPAPLDELANQPRRPRQSALEAEPFLQSIPAYRYVNG